jgi:hypothetical protein
MLTTENAEQPSGSWRPPVSPQGHSEVVDESLSDPTGQLFLKLRENDFGIAHVGVSFVRKGH